MLTLAITAILLEIANKWTSMTGGADGLSGVTVDADPRPVPFDLFGKTAFLYCLAVLFVGWLVVRRLIYSPFGAMLTGIRENTTRMHAIGAPVYWRLVLDLHHLGDDGRHRRRAAHAGQPVRRPQRARPRALGRPAGDADPRRRRPPLRRLRRPGGVHHRAGLPRQAVPRVLVLRHRRAAHLRGAFRPRRNPRTSTATNGCERSRNPRRSARASAR